MSLAKAGAVLRRPASRSASSILVGVIATGAAALAARLAFRSLRTLAARRHLEGKVVVVGGGTRGLGLAMARELQRRGARVAICGRSEESLERAQASLEASGRPVLAQVCDLRQQLQVVALLERVRRELGPIDVVIANAATIDVGPIESLTAADFDAAMRDIFGTTLQLSLAALPDMQKRRSGTIALIASIGGKLGVPHLAAYSAAKFAVVGLGEALRAEVRKDGVRVLTVRPGLMRTGSHVHAKFHGNADRELLWFGAAALAPIISIGADRAARYIIDALARRDQFLTFTPAARVGAWLHDVAPSLLAFLLSVMARALPKASSAAKTVADGQSVARHSSSRWLELLARHSALFALRYNQ